MSIGLYNTEGKKVKDLQVPEALVQGPIRKGLIYYMVQYQRAKKRAGTHETRTRGQVRGSTRKIYRQKGTGRARHGDRKANIFTGGGIAFGPHSRSYAYSMPKTARRRGLQTVVAYKNKEGLLMVVEQPKWTEPKTKQAVEFFNKLGVVSALLVVDGNDPNVEKSIRNLKDFKVIPVEGLNVFDALNYEKLILTEGALAKLTQRLKVTA